MLKGCSVAWQTCDDEGYGWVEIVMKIGNVPLEIIGSDDEGNEWVEVVMKTRSWSLGFFGSDDEGYDSVEVVMKTRSGFGPKRGTEGTKAP